MVTKNQRKVSLFIKRLLLIPGLLPKTLAAVLVIWVSFGDPTSLTETSSLIFRTMEAYRELRPAP